MNIREKQLKTTNIKTEKQVQITLEEDKNVPDSNIDIEKIVLATGTIKLMESEAMIDRIRVNGTLEGKILYIGSDSGQKCAVMDVSVPFEEYFHVESLLPTDHVTILPEMEDLNVTLIHSRKVAIRAVLNFFLSVADEVGIHAVEEVEADGVQALYKTISLTQLAVNKKDIVRLREEMALPASKPNIYTPLWNTVELEKVEYKLYDHKIQIQGELHVFLLYIGEEEHMPLQYMEWQIPVQTELECYECMEEMIGNIGISMNSYNLEIKPDEDGEMRIVLVEAGIQLDLKIYEEEEIRMLEDVYHCKKELIPKYESFPCQHLIVKNSAKMKLNQKVAIRPSSGRVLQILSMNGTCKIDEKEVVAGGVQIEGVIDGTVLYLTSDDNAPIASMPVLIPFSYFLEAKEMKEEDQYMIRGSMDQLNTAFSDGDEMEVRVEVRFDMVVLAREDEKIITDVEEKDWDFKELQKMPGIVGYLVKPEDTLWKIAKKYHTTVEELRRRNEKIGEEVVAGERILIVKEIQERL